MKLCRLLVLITLISYTFPVWSQSTRLILPLDSISLQELFFSIENQTEYRFFYNNDEVDVTRKVQVSSEEKTVAEILMAAFEKLPYAFNELDNKLKFRKPNNKNLQCNKKQ